MCKYSTLVFHHEVPDEKLNLYLTLYLCFLDRECMFFLTISCFSTRKEAHLSHLISDLHPPRSTNTNHYNHSELLRSLLLTSNLPSRALHSVSGLCLKSTAVTTQLKLRPSLASVMAVHSLVVTKSPLHPLRVFLTEAVNVSLWNYKLSHILSFHLQKPPPLALNQIETLAPSTSPRLLSCPTWVPSSYSSSLFIFQTQSMLCLSECVWTCSAFRTVHFPPWLLKWLYSAHRDIISSISSFLYPSSVFFITLSRKPLYGTPSFWDCHLKCSMWYTGHNTGARWFYNRIKLDTLKGENEPRPLQTEYLSRYDFNMSWPIYDPNLFDWSIRCYFHF